jgi:hypothetical protein
MPSATRFDFTCVICGKQIAQVLAQLGSTTCHDHRAPRETAAR